LRTESGFDTARHQCCQTSKIFAVKLQKNCKKTAKFGKDLQPKQAMSKKQRKTLKLTKNIVFQFIACNNYITRKYSYEQ